MFDPDTWHGKGIKNALPTLYSKTATGAVSIWLTWTDGPDVWVRWGQKDTEAFQDAKLTCTPKNVGRANATTAEEQARLEAIAKWKKQLKKKYVMYESQLTEFRLKPMLALNFEDHKHKIVYPAYIQPKYDGLRCLAIKNSTGAVHLQARGGDPYVVQHIANALWMLPSYAAMDGELYVHNLGLQKINSLVRRPQEGSSILEYHVYDFVLPDTPQPWEVRGTALARLLDYSGIDKRIVPVPTWRVHNEEEVKEYHDSFVQNGYEGAIVRTALGPYRFGYRSADLLKYKAFEDAEFPITGWSCGKGKFSDMAIFTCTVPAGVKGGTPGAAFEVVPAGTEQERKQLLLDAPQLVGKKLTVRYLGLTEEGKPRCAVGHAIREEGT